MRTADFNYTLPAELVAQIPTGQRDQSRLLVLHRDSARVEHRRFYELREFLRAGDLLVLNDSRVIPARLRGVNVKSRGAFEILLLEENAVNDWWVMIKPGKRARVGTEILFSPRNRRSNQAESKQASLNALPHVGGLEIRATVIETNKEGHRRLRFEDPLNILDSLEALGEVPLPPYINREVATSLAPDKARYQTVFAQPAGFVAAPTAGLHFTEKLLEEIRGQGVEVQFVTLHVGLGTFAPVKTEFLAAHVMHTERYDLSETTARAVNAAKADGRRVIAVGTTTVRVLESAFGVLTSGGIPHQAGVAAGGGRTKIFIHPPQDFHVVDALLTNFHLPCSTLLMLVSAFAAPRGTRGREMVLSTYAEAIREGYRFFSYGDAMLIL